MRYLAFIMILLSTGCERLTSPSQDQIETTMNNAYTLYQQKNYTVAIDTLNKAALLLAGKDSPSDLANCYNRLGLLYWAVKDTATSLNYYKRALSYTENDLPDLQAKILTNIGNAYKDIGDFIKALKYFNEIETLNLSKNNINYNYNLINLGHIYVQLALYGKARLNATEDLGYFNKISDSSYIKRCYVTIMICDVEEEKPFSFDYKNIRDSYLSLNLSEIYLKHHEYQKCDSICNLLNLQEKDDNNLLAWADYLYGISLQKQGQYQKSNNQLRLARQLNDSMDYGTLEKILIAQNDNFNILNDQRSLISSKNDLLFVRNKINKLNERNQLLSDQLLTTVSYQSKLLDTEIQIKQRNSYIEKLYLVFITLILLFSTSLFILYQTKKHNRNLRLALNKSVAQGMSNYFKF